MPYIMSESRKLFDHHLDEIGKELYLDGDLAYCVYKLALAYATKISSRVLTLTSDGPTKGKAMNFHILSRVAGVISSVDHEFRRRLLDPYEEEKRRENGDVSC